MFTIYHVSLMECLKRLTTDERRSHMKDQSILIALQLYSQNTLRIMNSQQCVQADKYLKKYCSIALP
jgi:hypothetical protein